MQTELVTEPNLVPISLKETKAFLEASNDQDDELIRSLIEAAVTIAEDYTNQCFIQRTIRQTFDRPDIIGNIEDYILGYQSARAYSPTGLVIPKTVNYLQLVKSPAVSINSVVYYTEAEPDTPQTWEPSKYVLKTQTPFARVQPIRGEYWPERLREGRSIVVEYLAGKAIVKNDVPESVRVAMKGIVKSLYDGNRGADGDMSGGIPNMAERLLIPHKRQLGF